MVKRQKCTCVCRVWDCENSENIFLNVSCIYKSVLHGQNVHLFQSYQDRLGSQVLFSLCLFMLAPGFFTRTHTHWSGICSIWYCLNYIFPRNFVITARSTSAPKSHISWQRGAHMTQNTGYIEPPHHLCVQLYCYSGYANMRELYSNIHLKPKQKN